MSLFVERKLVPPREISGTPLFLAWHPVFPIVALASYNDNLHAGSVVLFDHEGSVLVNKKPKTRLSYPEAVAWHPTRRFLVVAWRDGIVSQYDADSDGAHENRVGDVGVLILLWSKSGSHCAGVDKKNHLVVWAVPSVGSLHLSKPIVTHDLPQAVTCVAFVERQMSYSRKGILSSTALADQQETLQMLIGCKEGGLLYTGDDRKLIEAAQLSDCIAEVKFFEIMGSKSRSAYVMTVTNRVVRFTISARSKFEEKISILLSGKIPASSVCWLDLEILAVASVEEVVRVWDLAKGDNYELKTSRFAGVDSMEVVRSVAFNGAAGILVGTTNIGSLLFWQMESLTGEKQRSRIVFHPVSCLKLGSEVRNFVTSSTNSSFAAISPKHAYLLREHPLAYSFRYPLISIQTSADSFLLVNHDLQRSVTGKVSFQLEGISVTERIVAVWGERKVVVFQVSTAAEQHLLKLTEAGSFERNFIAMDLYGANIVAVKENSLLGLSLQGVIRSELRIQPVEGALEKIVVRSHYGITATSGGCLKLMDLDKLEAKHWMKSKVAKESIPLFGRFSVVDLNCDASSVAFLVDKLDNCADSRLYAWNVERNSIMIYDCTNTSADEQLALVSGPVAPLVNCKPTALAWQATDPRLLCVLLKKSDPVVSDGREQLVLATFFPTVDKGLLLNSVVILEHPGQSLLLGCHIPFSYLYASSDGDDGKLAITRRYLPDFKGFEPEKPEDLATILDFSYFSSLGKIAKALRIVKDVKAPSVWNHLARLCVRMERLEYAKICLGKLGRADILEDLRRYTEDHSSVRCQLTHLAILLRMETDFTTTGGEQEKKDLARQVGTASGDWDQVLESLSSSTVDRLHRRSVLYTMAQDDIRFGELDSAVKKLTEANCEKFDVPRLLLAKNPSALATYVEEHSDSKITTWYAQLLESQNHPDEAMECYDKAKDLKSVVRMLSHTDRIDEAVKLVRNSKNPAAAFQLAHALEVDEDTEPEVLVEFYTIARAYASAIRICINHGMDDRLMAIAFRSGKADMAVAAKYLEHKGQVDKAISLYHKAGQLSKASDLAFELGYYGNIETISDDINEGSDPQLIQKCVEYFVSNNQSDRAVNLLVRAKRLVEAIDLCVQHQITVDQNLISAVLEYATDNKTSGKERAIVVQKLAERCFAQGLFHDAARMLIEIGQPEAAMNALARTGDIDAISRYIRIIRDADALIVAGNSLQAHPWHQKREIFDAIVLAYKRAGAHLHLASFYDSWGETACESGRYEIAKDAFGKSFDVLKSVPQAGHNAAELETAKEEVDTKRKIVEYFLDVQQEATANPDGAVAPAEELLKHTKWDSGVRPGHVYAVLIATALAMKAVNKGRKYLQRLREECPKTHSVEDFIDANTARQLT